KGLNTHMSAFSVLSPNADLRVKHDRYNLCFSINLDGHQDSAVLRYKFTSKKEVDLLSTYVPESFRGKGVADLLQKCVLLCFIYIYTQILFSNLNLTIQVN
uniref:Protein NATD1 n=1 Tax=Oncorhynchus tshawytscha TaxID=74940 RepID=A0A8C8M9Y4_ONCTS